MASTQRAGGAVISPDPGVISGSSTYWPRRSARDGLAGASRRLSEEELGSHQTDQGIAGGPASAACARDQGTTAVPTVPSVGTSAAGSSSPRAGRTGISTCQGLQVLPGCLICGQGILSVCKIWCITRDIRARPCCRYVRSRPVTSGNQRPWASRSDIDGALQVNAGSGGSVGGSVETLHRLSRGMLCHGKQ